MSEEIFAALFEWNPWIEGDFPNELLGIDRDYDIISYLKIPEIKILQGVRRSGKSTLLYQIAKNGLQHGKKVLYINFDDEILKKHSLSDIYYAYMQHSEIDYLLIDEIQHCSEWVPFVRKFYDRKVLEQIWITGSNSSLISSDYAELLTGRNLKLTIHPLSFSEYLRFKGVGKVAMPISKQREALIIQQFKHFMTLGAFPAIALRPVYHRELLTNYFEDLLYKDIATRHDVNTTKLKDLAIFLATNSAKNFSYRNIAKVLGLHPNTVNDYVSYMQDVFIFEELYKFDFSLKKQYSNDKKIYIIDTGLANAVSFRFSEDIGRLLETLVYRGLKRESHDVYFHSGKYECDFIIKYELKITCAIQVTISLSDAETEQREINGIIDAMQTYNLKTGLILTMNESGEKLIERDNQEFRVVIKPVWKWFVEGELLNLN